MNVKLQGGEFSGIGTSAVVYSVYRCYHTSTHAEHRDLQASRGVGESVKQFQHAVSEQGHRTVTVSSP